MKNIIKKIYCSSKYFLDFSTNGCINDIKAIFSCLVLIRWEYKYKRK